MRHVAHHGEDDEPGVKTRETIDQGHDDGIPVERLV